MLTDEDLDDLNLYAQDISDETSDALPAMLELWNMESYISEKLSKALQEELENILDFYQDEYIIVEKEFVTTRKEVVPRDGQ